jgi:diguanylate cyclase (GGDEF)-like protein
VVCMIVIACCFVWLDYPRSRSVLFDTYGVDFLGRLAPLALVAYVTTMLSADTRKAMTEIKTLSETDDLTGILNRRAFLSLSAHTVNLAQRYARDFSIIMMDSDSMKAVNDAYGHDAGDELLKTMVSHTQQELRRPDLLARYGGDEFVLLLPDTNAEGARLTAERIRERIEKTPLAIGNIQVNITASMGVAAYPIHGADYDAVFEAADTALYASKSSGKNRVTVAQRVAPRAVEALRARPGLK